MASLISAKRASFILSSSCLLASAGCSSGGGSGGSSASGGVSGTSGASGSGGTGGSGNGGTAGTSGTSGASGAAGIGGSGGKPSCSPGSTESCYPGPAGTENVGACASGTRVCNSTGTAFGPCTGAVIPTIESCDTSSDENCDGIASCNGQRKWLQSFQVDLPEHTGCLRTAVDPEGNVVIAGRYESSIDFGLGPLPAPATEGLFVVKLDRDGKPIWNRSFDGAACVPWEADSIAIDVTGQIVLTGELMTSVDFGAGPAGELHDLFVAKLKPDGSLGWSQTYSPQGGLAGRRGIDTDSSGAITLAGDFSSKLELPGGPLSSNSYKRVFVARSGPDGTPKWAKAFAGELTTMYQGGALRSTPTGESVLAIQGNDLDFGGGLLPCSAKCLSIAKLDPMGAHLWSKSFADEHFVWWNDVALDATANVFLAGTFTGTLDFGIGSPFVTTGNRKSFFAKLSPAGAVLHASQFAASTSVEVTDLAIDAAGKPLLSGGFWGTLDLDSGPLATFDGSAGFIAKLDGSTKVLWSNVLGGTNVLAVAADPLGDVVSVGRFMGKVDLGAGPVECTAVSCIFVAKHAP